MQCAEMFVLCANAPAYFVRMMVRIKMFTVHVTKMYVLCANALAYLFKCL